MIISVCSFFAACASYEPASLPTRAALPDSLPHVVVDRQNLPFASLRAHQFNPEDGLDMDEVATVAVLNNPELKLARADAGIAHAQAFSAGLLPDPQLALSRDLSNTAGSAPGAGKAFSAGLSMDLMALLTYRQNNASAQADIKKTDLTLLWQEWQVVAQARTLCVQLMFSQKLAALLDSNRALFSDRVHNNQAAYDKKLISNEATLPDLTALQDIQRQSSDLERQINQYRHDLNSLLGVSPEAQIQLQEDSAGTDLDDAAIAREIPQLGQQRADLLALRSGFEAQDQRYRAALIAQFPVLSVGFTRARDSGGIFSNGIGVTLSVPLFNRNRGNIAIELATRDKLVADYQLRLDSAASDIHRLLQDRHLYARQLEEIQRALTQFRQVADNVDTAQQKNNVDTLIISNAHSALLVKQIEELTVRQAMQLQRVALLALLGGDLPEQRLKKNGS